MKNQSWRGINFPSDKGDWEKCEKSNLTINFNVFYTKMKNYILPTF